MGCKVAHATMRPKVSWLREHIRGKVCAPPCRGSSRIPLACRTGVLCTMASSVSDSWALFAAGAGQNPHDEQIFPPAVCILTAPARSTGAGVVEAVSVHPMDMVKTRQQLDSARVRPKILETTRSLLSEGGIPRLYRGIFAEIVGIVPKSSAMYASYDLSQQALRVRPSKPRHSIMRSHVSALQGHVHGLPQISR